MGHHTMTNRYYQDQYFQSDLEYRPDTEVATADQILPLVKSDLGLAFIPEPMAREALASTLTSSDVYHRRHPRQPPDYISGHPYYFSQHCSSACFFCHDVH